MIPHATIHLRTDSVAEKEKPDASTQWTLTHEDRVFADQVRSDPPPSTREIQKEHIDVVFQPIVELDDGAMFAIEALVRCKLPEFKSPPALFARAVEERACGRLGRTIREVAFERCGGVAVFVNIHPDELVSRWLVRPDDPIGFHSHDVYLEVTETAVFEHYDLCVGVLKEICSRAGAKIVVDDLGAGYSNLQRVLDLEPKIVKLDRAFIQDIDQMPRKQVLVRHLVRLCEELGAHVVAEGIETVEELRAVRDQGARFGQGYVLARPAYPIPAVHWPL